MGVGFYPDRPSQARTILVGLGCGVEQSREKELTQERSPARLDQRRGEIRD